MYDLTPLWDCIDRPTKSVAEQSDGRALPACPDVVISGQVLAMWQDAQTPVSLLHLGLRAG